MSVTLNQAQPAMPQQWRIALGFDFGQRRIGVAIGGTLSGTAQPLSIVPTRQQRPDWSAICDLIGAWHPDGLVVGVPHHADGTPNALTTAALRFSRQLHGRFHLPVATIDERLSSWEAQQRVLSKGRRNAHAAIDAEAAALILQSWLHQIATDPGR